MSVGVVGVNHRTAPIEVRERFHVRDEGIREAVTRVRHAAGVEECVVLSTCNRTEYYLYGNGVEIDRSEMERTLLAMAELEPSAGACLYWRRELETVTHLFRVVSGLDSLVIGEHQIQGQVKAAYELGRKETPESLGTVMHRLFQSALATGGKVRARTRIGEGAASVPTAATQLAVKVFGTLGGRTAVVLGAGAMGKLTLGCLMKEGIERAKVTNRTPERAERLAAELGVTALPLEGLDAELAQLDVLVTSTAASHPLITAARIRDARASELRPLVVLDISVPRAVEPEVGNVPGVFLYNVDDLQRVVDTAQAARGERGSAAAEIVARQAAEFWRWFRAREVVPVIREIRERAEMIREREIEAALATLEPLREADREKIRHASRQVVSKLLHGPLTRLRELASGPEDLTSIEVACRLFDLDRGESGEEDAE